MKIPWEGEGNCMPLWKPRTGQNQGSEVEDKKSRKVLVAASCSLSHCP